MKKTLRLKFRVAQVLEAQCQCHIIINANIEACGESKGMRIPIVQDESQRAAEQVAAQIQKSLTEIGMFQKKPISAGVTFFLTKEQFRLMGRPTVDDYIQVDATRTR